MDESYRLASLVQSDYEFIITVHPYAWVQICNKLRKVSKCQSYLKIMFIFLLLLSNLYVVVLLFYFEQVLDIYSNSTSLYSHPARIYFITIFNSIYLLSPFIFSLSIHSQRTPSCTIGLHSSFLPSVHTLSIQVVQYILATKLLKCPVLAILLLISSRSLLP